MANRICEDESVEAISQFEQEQSSRLTTHGGGIEKQLGPLGRIKRKEMVHWPFPFSNPIGRTKRFCDVSFGGSGSLPGRQAGNESAQQSARESAAGSVGRVGDDLFSRQPIPLPRGSEQEIVGPVEVAAGDHHVQRIVTQLRGHHLQTSGGRRHLFPTGFYRR